MDRAREKKLERKRDRLEVEHLCNDWGFEEEHGVDDTSDAAHS